MQQEAARGNWQLQAAPDSSSTRTKSKGSRQKLERGSKSSKSKAKRWASWQLLFGREHKMLSHTHSHTHTLEGQKMYNKRTTSHWQLLLSLSVCRFCLLCLLAGLGREKKVTIALTNVQNGQQMRTEQWWGGSRAGRGKRAWKGWTQNDKPHMCNICDFEKAATDYCLRGDCA